MKSIVLLICSVIATTLFAQPTTLDMKERYYMKGEVSEYFFTGGSGNASVAVEDTEGNFIFGGKAKMGDNEYATDWIEIYNKENETSKGFSKKKENKIQDCLILPDGYVMAIANPFVEIRNIQDPTEGKSWNQTQGVGFERGVYNPNSGNVTIFGVDKKDVDMRPTIWVDKKEGDPSIFPCPKALPYGYNSFEDYHKNNFAAINNTDFAMWAYEAKNKETDQTAVIGLVGYKEGKSSYGWDKIDVKAAIDNYVNDFRPYTSYENKAYERIYKVQWAMSGIHPKEDGSFLITISFIHWTTTASGKAGYQKGILGVVYQPTSKAPISEQWVVFPWAVKETTNMQEKMEIKPYYTSYIGGNDIAVFDQETGHLFAINSDLDACKSSDELGTCQAKSKELQKWLIVNRLIARIEPTGYSLGFAHPNTTPESGERNALTLVQHTNASGFKIIRFNP